MKTNPAPSFVLLLFLLALLLAVPPLALPASLRELTLVGGEEVKRQPTKRPLEFFLVPKKYFRFRGVIADANPH